MNDLKPIYLSRLILNLQNRDVQGDLADCQRLHCRVMTSFQGNLSEHYREVLGDAENPKSSGQANGGQARILYRVDFNRRQNRLSLLVQSQTETKPDWSRLPNDYLLDDFDELNNPAVKRIDESYGALGKGMRLRFRLRANPTKRLPLLIENRTGKERGKRVEIFGEENQLAWLARKAGEHGFRLLTASVNPNVVNARANPEGKVIGWRDRSEAPMKFGSALFEGELEITDAEAFKQTLAEGIGSGKAYGFGLLSIAPPR